MEQFIEKDYVLATSTAEDLIRIIEKSELPKDKIYQHKLFKKNCSHNIKNAMEEISKKI